VDWKVGWVIGSGGGYAYGDLESCVVLRVVIDADFRTEIENGWSDIRLSFCVTH